MKERNYLQCTVTMHDGKKFENPLMLSEAYLIKSLAKENRSVEVKYATCTEAWHKSIFGK